MEGVSTRRVDDLIKALGCDGISSTPTTRHLEQLDDRAWRVTEDTVPPDGGPYPLRPRDGLIEIDRDEAVASSTSAYWSTGVNADATSVKHSWVWTGRQRGRRVLAGLPAVVDGSRAQRGGTGNLRCPPGAEERHRRGVCWSQLATLPHPLHGQPAHPSAQACPTWSGHHPYAPSDQHVSRHPRPIGPVVEQLLSTPRYRAAGTRCAGFWPSGLNQWPTGRSHAPTTRRNAWNREILAAGACSPRGGPSPTGSRHDARPVLA